MILTYVLCGILCPTGIIILLSVIHHFERKDLYSRIMSKDLAEYRGKTCISAKSAHERVTRKWRQKGGENE